MVFPRKEILYVYTTEKEPKEQIGTGRGYSFIPHPNREREGSRISFVQRRTTFL